MGTADELAKLLVLRDSGELTPEQFEIERARVMSGAPAPASPSALLSESPPPTPDARSRKGMSPSVGCLSVFAVFVIVVIVVAVVISGRTTAHVTGTVQSVVAVNDDTLRISIDWANTGNGSGSATCTVSTTVHNEVGDRVGVEMSSISTDGAVSPGHHQVLYQTVGVTSGDAHYVTAQDVQLSGC